MRDTKIKSGDIEACFPIWKYREGCLVSVNADVTRCFEVFLPQIFSSSNKQLFGFHDAWTKAIQCLPVNSIVHKQDVFTEDRFRDECSPTDGFLRQQSAKYFNGKPYVRHRCFLYVTLSDEKNINASVSANTILKKRFVNHPAMDENQVREFNDKVEQFKTMLLQAEFDIREMERDELIGTEDKFGIIDQYVSLNFTGKGEILKDLCRDHTDLRIGDAYVSCFSLGELKDVPDVVSPALKNDKLSTDVSEIANCFASDICMGLPFNHIYNQYIYLVDNVKLFAKLETDGKRQRSFSMVSRENEINAGNNDEFLNTAHENGLKVVMASYNLLIWDNNYSRLQDKNSMAASALSMLGCTAHKTEAIVPEVFWAGIPGNAANYPKELKFPVFLPQACCFLNMESNYKDLCGKDRVGLKLTDRMFGIPVIVDVSNYPMEQTLIDNKNKFILGSSGSGKSFFTNLMVSQKYMSGDHVVIVDVGDSYQTLCNLIHDETHGEDGIYFTFSEKHPISFNPFYTEDRYYGEEKYQSLCAMVQILWKSKDEQIGKNELTQMRTSVRMYLDKVIEDRSVEPSFNSYYEFLKTDFTRYIENISVDKRNFDLMNMLQVLQPYYRGGQYDYLLNATDKLDLLKKRFVVFELDNIKDNDVIFPVVTLIIMDTFIQKMRMCEPHERKIMLIEEAWKAISQTGMAEFIKYLYKTVRKHNGEVAVVTQEPGDLIGNAIVKDAIINSADVKILLDLSKFTNRFSEIMSALALSEKDAALALSVNKMTKPPFKEVFISFNGKFSSVYRVETSWAEALSFTSRKEEKGDIYRFKEETGSMSQAILRYMEWKRKKELK